MFRHFQLRLFAALAAIICLLGFARAQVSPGMPSFSAYDSHTIDTVNLQNLNVALNIPVMSKSGALPFNATLTGGNSYFYYNGTNVQPGVLAVPLTPSINGVLSPFGYAFVLPATTTANATCPHGYGTGTANEYSDWYLQFPDGTVHNLPITDSAYGGTSCSSSFTDQVLDGTGWMVTVNGGMFYSSGQYGVTIVSSGGLTISSVLNSTYIQDAQSTPNKISYAISEQEYTDTLGTEVLTVNANTAGQLGWFDVNGGNPTESQTLTDSTLKTSFGCSGKPDYPATGGTFLTTEISYPDSTSLLLGWEPNEVTSTDYTGRLASIKLRGGGTISYNWNPSGAGSSGNYGLNCTYLVPNSMTRTTSDGTTKYVWTPTSLGNGNYGNTTTVTDQGGNVTVYTFTGMISGQSNPVGQTITQVQHYQGSSTLLTTDVYCYDGLTPSTGCTTSLEYVLPINEVDVFHTISGMSTSSRTQTKYDKYGNITYSAQYDFATTPTVPTTTTTTVYGSYSGGTCNPVSSTINNKPCTITTTQNGNTVAQARYTYDGYGNLVTQAVWNGSSWLSNSTLNVYNANGTISTSYDLANNQTSYGYSSSGYVSCGGCTNFPFPTSITQGGLTTSSTWNGVGGVKLTDKNANPSGNTTTYGYASSGGTADPWWRLRSVTDPLGNEAWLNPTATNKNSTFSFNGGNSITNVTGTADGYGRTINAQKEQSPTSTNYDTTSTGYGWSGNYRSVETTIPCSTTSGSLCSFSSGVTTTLLDPLGRPYTITNGGSPTPGVITTTYPQNDVLSVVSPASPGENTKSTQNEYDGLGRLKSVCGIMASGGYSSCSQNNGTYSGQFTSYTYTSATGSATVTATRGSQSRSKTNDGLGRVISSATPEGGTTTFAYDTVPSACNGQALAYSGKLIYTGYPNGSYSCNKYDSLGRPVAITGNSGSGGGPVCRRFYYDNSSGVLGTIPTGISISNPYGRMVEAETDNCTVPVTSLTMITDEWFSYDKNGNVTDIWELTPHSGTYYHSVATFAGSGTVTSLTLQNIASNFTSTYGLDGEGRWNQLTTYRQVIVPASGVTFNAAGNPTSISIGSGTDNDSYTYDGNTGRMTNWQFTVGSKNETGTLTWNPNGTLNNLAILDGFNTGGTQTCLYNPSSGMGYDDLGRLLNVSCGPSGTIWNQAFSYDQYDNLKKTSSGPGISWTPGYNSANNHYTLAGTSYDNGGNLLNDTFHSYTWDPFNKLSSVDSSACGTSGECVTYDALGRAVEISNGATYTEIWYTQLGKTAYMNGSTFSYAFWPAPGGGKLLQTTGYNYYFQHKDWLGSTRITSGLGTAIIDDRAFAPYGEMYQNFGSTSTNELDFTGDTQDIVAGSYDTPNRELNPNQGRWLSPDPVGAGWNLYAYPTNPNSATDPSGLLPKPIPCMADPAAGKFKPKPACEDPEQPYGGSGSDNAFNGVSGFNGDLGPVGCYDLCPSAGGTVGANSGLGNFGLGIFGAGIGPFGFFNGTGALSNIPDLSVGLLGFNLSPNGPTDTCDVPCFEANAAIAAGVVILGPIANVNSPSLYGTGWLEMVTDGNGNLFEGSFSGINESLTWAGGDPFNVVSGNTWYTNPFADNLAFVNPQPGQNNVILVQQNFGLTYADLSQGYPGMLSIPLPTVNTIFLIIQNGVLVTAEPQTGAP